MRTFVSSQSYGFVLLEIVLYTALLSTCLTALLPAGYQVLREANTEAERLKILADHMLLDQKLGKLFACGTAVEVTERDVRINCVSHTEHLALENNGTLALVRSSDSVVHVLTREGEMQRDRMLPMFTYVENALGVVQVRGLYEGVLFLRTYYAASEF